MYLALSSPPKLDQTELLIKTGGNNEYANTFNSTNTESASDYDFYNLTL